MRRPDPAFTLLETLIALGIFSFAVLGLLFALHMTADAAVNVQREKKIRTQMENRLAKLSIPPFKESSEKNEEDGVSYAEEIRREDVKTKEKSLLQGYWRVQVKAAWEEGTAKQEWEASHLVWSP